MPQFPNASQIATLPLPHIAAREAYVAVFHAAEAYFFEQTGKVAKTHRGLRKEANLVSDANSSRFLPLPISSRRKPIMVSVLPPRRLHPPR
jgi:hypothetical protein